MSTEFSKFQDDIVFWGPPASGKSWLINAFAKELQNYEGDPNFYYELKDSVTDVPIFPSPEPIAGTSKISDSVWEFSRKAKKHSFSHEVSSHIHRIRIRDDRGYSTFTLDNMLTKATFREFDSVFLLLDPTSVGNTNEESDIKISPSLYAEKIRNLFETMNLSSGSQRFIAVCITKIDQLGARQRDPWEIINIYFGNDLYKILNQYRSFTNLSIQTFSTSAFGFLPTVKREPNYDPSTGTLRSPDLWEPYNVASPFFWIFENIERRRIMKFAYDSFLQKLLFRNDRLKNYIPYPVKRK